MTETSIPSLEYCLLEPLTSAEERVLLLLAQGMSDKEIGLELSLAPITIRGNYKQNIYDKLGLPTGFRNRKWAVHCARQIGLLPTLGEEPDLAAPGDNPYKGLDAFQQDDAHVFFGREAFVSELTDRLSENGSTPRFMAIVGPSGSGKSSIVRAGLIPGLKQDKIPGASTWAIATMFPRVNPLYELELALRAVAVKGQTDVLDLLQRDSYGLSRVTRLILPEEQPLLLVIDQFEEIFTLAEDTAQARTFMDLIYAAATDPRSTVRVIITLRADFLDRPLMYPDFSWLVQNHTAMVVPLTPDELERAITLPAKQAHVNIEPGLVARLVAEANEQPGALPLLEFALTELYDNRVGRTITMSTYEEIGGLQQALAAQADKTYTELDDDQQEAARQLLLRLITPGEGTEDVRRRVPTQELTSLEAQTEIINYVTHFMAANRLLTLDIDPTTKEPTAEVAHEALIREWGRLRAWLDESRNDIRMERMLAIAAQEWHRHDLEESYLMRGSKLGQFEGWRATTDLALTVAENRFLDASIVERDRQRRRRRVARNLGLAAVIVTAIVMTVLALWANNQRKEAEGARTNEQTARLQAERDAEFAQSAALASAADAALARGDLETATTLAYHANLMDDPPPFSHAVLYSIASEPGLITRFRPENFADPVAEFTEDEQTLVLYSNQAGKVVRYDMVTGEQTWIPLEFNDRVDAYRLSADATTLLTVERLPGTLREWDTQTGKLLNELMYNEGKFLWAPGEEISEPGMHNGLRVQFVDYTPDGSQIVLSGIRGLGWPKDKHYSEYNHSMFGNMIIDRDTWQIVNEYDIYGPINGWDAETNQRAIAQPWIGLNQISEDRKSYEVVRLQYELETGGVINEIVQHSVLDTIISGVVTSHDGRKYVRELRNVDGTGAMGYELRDAATREKIMDMEVPFAAANTWEMGSFSSDDQLYVSGTDANVLAVWDIQTGQVLYQFSQPGAYFGGVFFDNNQKLMTISRAGDISIWDLTSGTTHTMASAKLIPGWNDWFLRSRNGEVLGLFDPVTGIIDLYRWHDDQIVDQADFWYNTRDLNVLASHDINADGSLIVSGHEGGTIAVWNTNTGERIRQFDEWVPTDFFDILATGDNQVFFVFSKFEANTPKILQALNIETGDELWRVDNSEQVYGYVDAWPVDQNRMLLARQTSNQTSNENFVTYTLIDIHSGEILQTFGSEDNVVRGADVTADLQTIVTISEDGFIRFYDLDSSQEYVERRIAYDVGQLQEVMFVNGQDNYLLVSGSDRLSVLDAHTGAVVRAFDRASTDGYLRPPGDLEGVVIVTIPETEEARLEFKYVDFVLEKGQLLNFVTQNRHIRPLTGFECRQYQVPHFCGD